MCIFVFGDGVCTCVYVCGDVCVVVYVYMCVLSMYCIVDICTVCMCGGGGGGGGVSVYVLNMCVWLLCVSVW